MTIKINFLVELVEGPYGGSHQFLKSLRKKLIEWGLYVENHEEADILIFDSFQFLDKVAKVKFKYPEKIFLQRMDGPIKLYNGMGDVRENYIYLANQAIADGTIFQSEWSRHKNHEMGLATNRYETVIHNAPDPEVFYSINIPRDTNKINLVATSWSANWKKGFDIYYFLDEELDFDRYNFTFVGNAPKPFRRVKHLNPVPSNQLADILRENDIFISGSHMEACSNSLLEAMQCGLPAIARNNSSHPELIGNGGLLFEGAEDILLTIEQAAEKIDKLQKEITQHSILDSATGYRDFAEKIHNDKASGRYRSKSFSLLKFMQFKTTLGLLRNWQKIFKKFKG